MEDLIKKLQAIAKHNNDKFCYRMEIEAHCDQPLAFHFIAEETEEYHVFAEGVGSTIPEAVAGVLANLKESCDYWGYKMP